MSAQQDLNSLLHAYVATGDMVAFFTQLTDRVSPECAHKCAFIVMLLESSLDNMLSVVGLMNQAAQAAQVQDDTISSTTEE